MPRQTTLTTTQRGYGHRHQRIRAELSGLVLAGGVACARCGGEILPGQDWHLGHSDDRAGYSGPEHAWCNVSANRGGSRRVVPELEVERQGLAADDPRWDVSWLKSLRRVPADATWPRLMTVPHSRAVGSLGQEFSRWAQKRSGFPLRWWQQLVAARLLEIDADGRLVWETLVLSMARQLGKSWLLRELCLWRMHQARRFGQEQSIVHTGKDVSICKEVQRPALVWAKDDSRARSYKIKQVNGQEQLEYLPDSSRWLIKAKEAAYGYSVSLAVVDEAWAVDPRSIDDGLIPTTVETEQSQLLLVSTAHRKATPLVLDRRKVALDDLEVGDGDLLVEWSAPHDAAVDDLGAWRLASPHWTPKRERLIGKQLEAARAGNTLDAEEINPEQSFKAQWLNIWPRRPLVSSQELLPAGTWLALAEPNIVSSGPVWVAVEDDYGLGAAVAVAAWTDDGRIEVDGWLRPDWDRAMDDIRALSLRRELELVLVGASLLDRVPSDIDARPAGQAETRDGLPLLRDLCASGTIVHDANREHRAELDDAVRAMMVREERSGLMPVLPGENVHLVKALVWAVGAAHSPAPEPAIY